MPTAPNRSGGFDSQPPSLPPSPGLSYRTPRTPSSRHRSVTPSHHSSGNTSSRSRTLTEPDNSASLLTEVSRSRPIFTDTGFGSRWEYEVTMLDGTIQAHPASPSTVSKLMILITMSDGHVQHRPASPQTVDHVVEETSRAMACRQALESPLTPRSSAIPQNEIASYPQEWRNGAPSGRYSYIPSYQGWHRGEQPELARSELAGLSRPTEQPLSPVPGPSTRTDL